MLNLVLTVKSDFSNDSLIFLLSSSQSLAEKSLLEFLFCIEFLINAGNDLKINIHQ